MQVSKQLQIGKAGEHLVVAQLLLQGYTAFLADQGSPYDVVLDAGRLYRIQVRSSSGERRTRNRYGHDRKRVYYFHLTSGKHGRRRITANDCELFAFVALDTHTIAYVPTPLLPQQVWTAYTEVPARRDQNRRYTNVRLIDQFPIDKALAEVQCII